MPEDIKTGSRASLELQDANIKDGPRPSVVPYTIFTRFQKHMITVMMGIAMFFSPMTANIYFPCIPALERAMNASLQQINLTITAYVVLQGISPLFVGDLADKIGRRPVYLLTFILFTAASLGLALNRNSYAVLLALRTLQSAGCSATAAISYGVLADVAVPSERGRMLGAAMVAANVGPAAGPLIGGVLAGKAGWRWVFWFLVIIGGAFLIALALIFPETSRALVGNGSIPASPWNRPLVSLYANRHDKSNSSSDISISRISRPKFGFPNPLSALRIMFYADAALILWLSAVHYMAYYCIQATIPGLFAPIYDLTELQIGLSYLAIGIGVAAGGYSNGKFLDINYRHTARNIFFTIDRVSGDDLRVFPIEKARTRFSLYLIPIHAILLIGYGWIIKEQIPLAVPLVFQFWLGFLATCIVQTFNTLLVDVFPSNPSTASASGNITRCALSAAGIAAIQPLFNCLGHGWVFTMIGAACGISGLAASLMLRNKGMQLRTRRNG